MAFFYGIGHALVDYFFDGELPIARFSPELQAAAAARRPVHIGSRSFDELTARLQAAAPDWSSKADGIRTSGGTCANMLKTLAALGAETLFSGSCGCTQDGGERNGSLKRDEEALFFQKSLAQSGVSARLKLRPDRTGRCLAVRDGRTSFILAVSPGAAPDIAADQINPKTQKRPDWIIAEGMPLAIDSVRAELNAVRRALRIPLAVACGTPAGAVQTAAMLKEAQFESDRAAHVLSANVSSAHAPPLSVPPLHAPPAIVFANDGEARMLEREGIDPARYSADYGTVFVVTHGCGGSSAYAAGSRISVPARTAAECAFTDETGAGDVFAGAFLFKLTEPQPYDSEKAPARRMERCLVFGSEAAARILSVPLCRVTKTLLSGLT